MKQTLTIILFFITSITFNGCVGFEPPKLPPNHLLDGTYIDIHSPDQEGWSEVRHSDSGVVFRKYGEKHNESYIASVIFFPLEKKLSEQEFLQYVKQLLLTSRDKNRYDTLKSDIQLSNKRQYPCVLGNVLYRDKSATTKKGNKEPLLMHVKSLYCKDPKRKNQEAGFLIGYSYRGDKINPFFNKEADSFIRGVEFPEYK